MEFFEIFPNNLIWLVILNALLGVFTLFFGRFFSRGGLWVCVFSLFLIFFATILGGSKRLQEFYQETPPLNWLGISIEHARIHLQIHQDSASMAMAALGVVLSLLLIFYRNSFVKGAHDEKIYGSALISTSGLVIAWFSATPWLGFIGISLGILGGFFALGFYWRVETAEAKSGARYLSQSCCGLILSVVGAAAMRISAPYFDWNSRVPFEISPGLELGAFLLAFGLYFIIKPFPFLVWAISDSSRSFISRLLFSQVFLGWAVFAVLVRLEHIFRTIGVFPLFGWIALVSAAISFLVGLFQKEWSRSVYLWVNGGFCLSIAALAFSGPWTGTTILLGTGLSALAMSFSGVALESGQIKESENPSKAKFLKAVIFLAAYSGGGGLGFLFSGGALRWLELTHNDFLLAGSVGFAILLSSLLLWRLAMRLAAFLNRPTLSWFAVSVPAIFNLLSLALLWTGTVSGGVILGNPDKVFKSVLDLFFLQSSVPAFEPWVKESAFYWGSWFLWGGIFLGVGLSFSLRKKWTFFEKSAPRVTHLFRNGFLVEAGLERLLKKGIPVLQALNGALVSGFWNHWLSLVGRKGIGAFSWFFGILDHWFSQTSVSLSRRTVIVPAKVLQVVQSGNVQWYLFFVIGSAVAFLIHFLKL